MKNRFSCLLLATALVAVSCSPKYYANRNRVPDELPDGGGAPSIPIANDGTVEVKLYKENSMIVKDYSKYFDIDYLRSLLESR